MNNKTFFQTACAVAVVLALSACAISPKVDVPTLASSGQIMSEAETAKRYSVNGQ